jgi:endonuclease/exonuclease/phosphatase family metal-dependent hydrolase
MAATVIPLISSVRVAGSELLQIFDDRLRGWIWLFAILLMIVIGNRFVGVAAVLALILAQLMAVMVLWWIPVHSDSNTTEPAGPSVSIGIAVLFALVYLYSLSIGITRVPSFVRGQALTVILIAGAALGLARLGWREEDPWREEDEIPRPLSAMFAVPMIIIALVMSAGVGPKSSPSLGEGLRVATYNINRGYNEDGVFSLEAAARTIEASLADVIVLQEVDAGSPLGFGIDQAEYLARRMGMYYAYMPTQEYVEGIAILSRWPIADQRSVLFPTDPVLGALRVRVFDASSGRSLDTIGSQMLAGTEELRLQQTALIFSIVDQNVPSILAIDMNAGPLDSAYQQLTGTSFVDPDVVLGIERGFTTPASDPTLRYDYVLVRGLVPEDSRQVQSDQEASDHRLVVVSVLWP